MKISIIIPVYNGEKYIEQCLKSALSQTIEEKEIICIDDGSTDDSWNIINMYRQKYDCIKVFKQENKGSGAARNLGLKYANGKFVCFLDSDDFYIENAAIEKMIEACERNHVKACAALRQTIMKYQEIRKDAFFRELFCKNMNEEIVLDFYDIQNDFFYQNYIFSLEAIRENNLKFPDYRRYQDPPFFLQLMIKIRYFAVVPLEFYSYRFIGQSEDRAKKYILHTLCGITDNLHIAHDEGLEDLKKTLINRVIGTYSKYFINSDDEKVIQQLMLIQDLVNSERSCIAELQKKELFLIISMVLKHKKIVSFLKENNIDNLAIYGLGNYGRLLTILLENENIKLYGIDKQHIELENVSTVTLQKANIYCSYLIITPIKYEELIRNEISSLWQGKILLLSEFVFESLN